MLLDIPDLMGHEKETLYIIGNGFDRAHNLPTRYSDFHDWLMKDHQDFVEIIEAIFEGRDKTRFTNEEERPSLLWTDFEAALGRIDAHTAMEYLGNKYDNLETDRKALDLATEEIRTLVYDVNSLMLEWSRHTPITIAQRLYNLSNASRYLTFNYTLTLEEGYDINTDQILHIHGKVSEDNVIVGCERDVNRPLDNTNQGRRRYTKQINAEFNHFNKPVDDLIEGYEDFFQSLTEVNRVVVIGHSLTEIDIPYISEVCQHVSPDTHWHFSAFSDKDHQNIRAFIDTYLGESYKNKYIFNVRLMMEDKDKPIESKAQRPPEPKKVNPRNRRVNPKRYVIVTNK